MALQNLEAGGGTGGNISIQYQDTNNRIQQVTFEINPGYAARAMVKEDGVVVYDRTIGQGTLVETVPGNYRLRTVVDPIDGFEYLDWPAGIEVFYWIWSL